MDRREDSEGRRMAQVSRLDVVIRSEPHQEIKQSGEEKNQSNVGALSPGIPEVH